MAKCSALQSTSSQNPDIAVVLAPPTFKTEQWFISVPEGAAGLHLSKSATSAASLAACSHSQTPLYSNSLKPMAKVWVSDGLNSKEKTGYKISFFKGRFQGLR